MMQKMKLFTLLLVMIFSPIAISDKKITGAVGKIYDIDRNSINVADARYSILPTVNIFLQDNKKGSISDLIKGDVVKLNIVTINKRQFVDTISILSDSE